MNILNIASSNNRENLIVRIFVNTLPLAILSPHKMSDLYVYNRRTFKQLEMFFWMYKIYKKKPKTRTGPNVRLKILL